MSKLDVLRGFDESEYAHRTNTFQELLKREKLDCYLLTTDVEFEYFAGFYTQFWHSPTRPWFLIIPSAGKPIAVVPEIGYAGMCQTWLDEIHTWQAPNPQDDGVSLLSSIIDKIPSEHGRIGASLGVQSTIRMPFSDFVRVKQNINKEFVDAAQLVHNVRFVKSPAEIAKIECACRITNDAYDKLPSYARVGMSEREIVKQLRMDMVAYGADKTPYVVAGSGKNGYDNIIMGPTDRVIGEQDVLNIDSGVVFDGYYSDFNRNWGFGSVNEQVHNAYRALYHATTVGFETARPNTKMSDIYGAMWNVLQQNGATGNTVGRMGHGLGIQLTEQPSITAQDHTVLKTGMVITLEPCMTYAPNKSMVHEENIVITEDGARWLTRRTQPELTIIQ